MNNRLHDDSGLLRQSILMMAGTLIGALCNAAFHMAVGRILPNAEYGALAAMLGLILVVGTPMLAVQNTLAHYIAILQRENRAAEIRPLCLRWLRFFVALAIIMVAAAIFFRHQLAAFWHVSPALIVTTFAVLAITLWLSLLYGLLQGMQAFVWLAIAPQAWGALRLLLGWAFTAFVAAQALLAVVAQGIGVIAVLLLGAIAIRQMQLPRGRAGTPPPDTLRYLGASLVALVGYAMLMNLDATLAKHYFDAETSGLFSKAATIARTAASIDAIPASHSIGVEARDKVGGRLVLDYLVREGDQLPKKGKKSFKAGESLKAGSAGSIKFKLWEGEISDPINDNRFIGMFEIKGTDFDDGVIAAGAEMVCEFEVLDSGNIILEVSVTSISTP